MKKKEVLKVKNTDKAKSVILLKSLYLNYQRTLLPPTKWIRLKNIWQVFTASLFEKGDLKLYINDVELTYDDPEILNAPYYTNPKGIPTTSTTNFSSDKYKVTGFIGILNTMSTSEVNGLSLFRRGRVIEGSHDEK